MQDVYFWCIALFVLTLLTPHQASYSLYYKSTYFIGVNYAY